MFRKEETFAVMEIIKPQLNESELQQLDTCLVKSCAFMKKEISLEALDEHLLFTGNKVKEAFYAIEEQMYKGKYRSIRSLIEVSEKPLYNF